MRRQRRILEHVQHIFGRHECRGQGKLPRSNDFGLPPRRRAFLRRCQIPVRQTFQRSRFFKFWPTHKGVCSSLSLVASCNRGRFLDGTKTLILLSDLRISHHRSSDTMIHLDRYPKQFCACWRRSGFFWRMRASLGLARAQATTLCSQVFGKANPRSRAGHPRP